MTNSDVDGHLDAHAKSIDELHRKLGAVPGTDQEKLKGAVDKLKKSYAQFTEDAKGCMR